MNEKKVLDKEALKRYLVKEYTRKNITQMANVLSLDRHTVSKYIKFYKFKPSKYKNKNIEKLTLKYLTHEYIKLQKSAKEIGMNVGCSYTSVCNKLKELNIRIRPSAEYIRKYPKLNLETIRTMKTKNIAYFIGFITADGCITYSDAGKDQRLILQIAEKDIEILKNFKKVFKITHKIHHRMNNKCMEARLEVKQPGLLEAFKPWNIVPRKSSTIKFPKKIPKDKLGSYLRGLFDGDGCISFTYNKKNKLSSVRLRIYTGSLEYATGLSYTLKKECKIKSTVFPINKNNSCYCIQIPSYYFNDFYSLLYPNKNSISLDRKRKRFLTWKSHLKNRGL